MARIGIYGGSFNPPHVGHTLAAEELIKTLALDRLLVIPAATPPHKSLPEGSPSAEERLLLTRLSFARLPEAEVSDIELRRQGPSYTVDTLRELRRRYPDDELFLLMGTDMLLSFESWYCPEEISRLAVLAVMHREQDEALWQRVEETARRLRSTMGARVVLTENRCITVSSTAVRRLLALKAPGYLEPPAAEEILSRGWYRSREDFTRLPYDRLREVSLSLHDEKRRPHARGCSDTAAELARRWGADAEAARRAGILHDITKALNEDQHLHLCRKYDIVLTDLQRQTPKLLHAKTGAVVARAVFGESAEVFDAIWWHTTGRAGMSLLEKIIYIADYMEPNRCFSGVEVLRKLVWEDLDAAIFQGLDQSVRLLTRQGRTIDPDSLEGWRYYGTKTERSNDL